MKDRGTGEHKDYAFVAFKTKQVTQKAIEEIHSKESKVFTVLPKSFFLLFLTLILFLLLKNNKVVNEIHGSSTKKNKEYQEKLHVVVLRAEEIIFSKANFEAEYMDLTTLLERTNDAIDTIIQHDEHTETGEYLRRCFKGSILLYSILIISSCAISV
ncbi:Heterogeneous nuclear ribonucleoprotein Q [Glycine max]|nr:Heterogeneous nuclear ribonucleoprotein Q [Glycine max]